MFTQQETKRQIEARGGKVFAFDRGESMNLVSENHAQQKLDRMRRHGSRKVKVAVRRAGMLNPSAAVAAVRIATRG
ncbi:hypothetical protein LMG22037_06373 [Paraburkholderia phenoliruptrix]|uniref:Uncharacterized protein n=1 Tax=Paraburkholderia phenoliruptrix TaxID=252970 RepID=A0A6J5CP27_9BURK|nr:hypothetical protein [Paraburkholderia phenoliruptrix]CAB3740234.1 hypothetical protein LMG22037_06373 [Paraburkholderia phenoliruptrix]